MTRVPTLAMVVLGGFGFVGPASAQAPISQYPYCMQGDDNPGWSGCSFNVRHIRGMSDQSLVSTRYRCHAGF
jgi:hypothetical protein